MTRPAQPPPPKRPPSTPHIPVKGLLVYVCVKHIHVHVCEHCMVLCVPACLPPQIQGPRAIPGGILVAGDNTIAVELHQSSDTTDVSSINLQLTMVRAVERWRGEG